MVNDRLYGNCHCGTVQFSIPRNIDMSLSSLLVRRISLRRSSATNAAFTISKIDTICFQCKPDIISFCKARGLVIARIVFASRVLP